MLDPTLLSAYKNPLWALPPLAGGERKYLVIQGYTDMCRPSVAK